MSCGYDCEYSCEECDIPDKVIDFVNGYNQALEDMRKGIKEILEDNAIYNIDCIDTLIEQLTINI